MAQKVSIILVDDIDESEADETVRFGLDGVNYEIDLNAAHAGELREALALYVAHGRRVSGRRRSGAASSSGSAAGGASAAEIRSWARDSGMDVPERGRIPADVRTAYNAAH